MSYFSGNITPLSSPNIDTFVLSNGTWSGATVTPLVNRDVFGSVVDNWVTLRIESGTGLKLLDVPQVYSLAIPSEYRPLTEQRLPITVYRGDGPRSIGYLTVTTGGILSAYIDGGFTGLGGVGQSNTGCTYNILS